MEVTQRVPVSGQVELHTALTQLSQGNVSLPFSPNRIEFVAKLSRYLARNAKGHPEIQALAFWMRKAEVAKLAADFESLNTDGIQLLPRGTVFHIPPSNVDTIFVYSLVLSILCGNRNIVRLSSKDSEQTELLVSALNAVLQEFPELATATLMLSYGHEDHITAAISEVADTRVIWGGDQTVHRVRTIPIPPHCTELTFPDRVSFTAIKTEMYELLPNAERDDLAEQFFNDTYWFDQQGCSSSRLVIWVEETNRTSLHQDFFDRVYQVSKTKGYQVDAASAMAKFRLAASSTFDNDVIKYQSPDSRITVLTVSSFPNVEGDFCGTGIFHQWSTSGLNDIWPHIHRKAQTLTTFGFSKAELADFVCQGVGRGIDRVVPIGQALQFDRMWDGFDLLQSLTRRVTYRD